MRTRKFAFKINWPLVATVLKMILRFISMLEKVGRQKNTSSSRILAGRPLVAQEQDNYKCDRFIAVTSLCSIIILLCRVNQLHLWSFKHFFSSWLFGFYWRLENLRSSKTWTMANISYVFWRIWEQGNVLLRFPDLYQSHSFRSLKTNRQSITIYPPPDLKT